MIRRPRGVFVVGTDTGVGKTLIAAGLAWALRRRGLDVGVMKPVESGVAGQGHADAELLRRVAGASDPMTDISPYRFGPPLAPLVAARRRRTRISLATIVHRFHRLARGHDMVIVEGVGGLMVPLTQTRTTLDLAQALGLPLLLVIGNRLGAINHTLLTVEAVQARGLRFIGGVINQASRERDAAVRTNPHILQNLVSFRRWAVMPYSNEKESPWKAIGKRLEQAGLLDDLIRRS
jgi:dethiobiotin synthetase